MARALAGTLIAVLALALVVAVAGCGGSDDPAPRKPAGDLRDLEHRTLDKATKAQIEQFAEVRIPASATNLRSFSRSAMDTQLLVSFRIPRKDLDAFVRSGNFRMDLIEGNRVIGGATGDELGWHVDRATRVAGLSDVKTGLGRNLVVVLDDPKRPAVYLEAATI